MARGAKHAPVRHQAAECVKAPEVAQQPRQRAAVGRRRHQHQKLQRNELTLVFGCSCVDHAVVMRINAQYCELYIQHGKADSCTSWQTVTDCDRHVIKGTDTEQTQLRLQPAYESGRGKRCLEAEIHLVHVDEGDIVVLSAVTPQAVVVHVHLRVVLRHCAAKQQMCANSSARTALDVATQCIAA